MKTLSLLLLLVALFALVSPAAAYKKRMEWTEEELEALEKSWEANDAEEELDTPERRHRLEMEARKTKKAPAAAAAASEITPEGGVSMPPGMPPGGPPMMGAQAGPMMMFVNLLPEQSPDKTAWSSKDIEVLTKKWRTLLMSGGVNADVYNLDDKVLVIIERHLMADTKEFLFDQSEVDYLTLDQHDMYPKGRRRKE